MQPSRSMPWSPFSGLLLPAMGLTQESEAAVNCDDERLTARSSVTCQDSELTELTRSIDDMTVKPQTLLTGAEELALVDTEEPFVARYGARLAGSQVRLSECQGPIGAVVSSDALQLEFGPGGTLLSWEVRQES